MTDSTNHAHEDLDARWDDAVPAPAPSVQSRPPTPELEQIDAGWERESAASNAGTPASLRPVSASGIPASGRLPKTLEAIDKGWDADNALEDGVLASSRFNAKRVVSGKKDRRELERKARVHQVERVLENREQRKVQRRDAAKLRREEEAAKHAAAAEKKQARSRHKAERRPAQPKRKPADQPGSSSSSAVSAPKPNAPNRAERRARPGTASGVGAARVAVPTTAAKKALIGPFTLFIAVVLAASVLSYAFIR